MLSKDLPDLSKRIAGLDMGMRRIGVAISDPTGMIAQPLTMVERKGLKNDLAAIVKILDDYEVKTVVYGLPKNMDGSSGKSVEMVEEFIAGLKSSHSVECIPCDERLSTVFAERALIEGNVRREKRKSVVDKVAAGVILQGYLDKISNQNRQ